MRLLDELADAFRSLRGTRVVSSDRLADQFLDPVSPADWSALGRRLPGGLPLLDFDAGRWWPPPGLTTVWDVCDRMAASRPEWEPPSERTDDAWCEAQVFAGVRAQVCEMAGLKPAEVTREARLMEDLGME